MLKAIKLIGFGIIPMVVGFLLNWLMMLLPIYGIVSILLAVVFLLLWGYFAFKLSNSRQNSILQAFLMCAFGLIMLALVLYQELAMGQYWINLMGFATQMFFLPCLSLASLVVSPFMDVIRVWPMYIVIWAAMFIASCIGVFVKGRS